MVDGSLQLGGCIVSCGGLFIRIIGHSIKFFKKKFTPFHSHHGLD
jgi:hypothetical protein